MMVPFLMLICSVPVYAGGIVDLSTDLQESLGPVPSLAAAVVKRGQIVAMGTAGLRKQGAPDTVQTDDKYHIGSCTKSMTAVLAARLVEEGHITWDTRIADAFEGWTLHAGYRDATLRHLLTNTGGAPKDIDEDLWRAAWEAVGTPAEQRFALVRGLLARAPASRPGSRYEYSNAGFTIAGAMLEQAAGEAYESLLARYLFQPLGMHSAGFGAPATPGRVDQPYGHVQGEGGVIPVDPVPAGDNPAAIAPAGGVHCSVTDLARYTLFHLESAGQGILAASSRAVLYQASPLHNYAMGWVCVERPWAQGRAYTHAGSNTMFYAVLWLAPEMDAAVMVLCNYGGPEANTLCDRVAGQLIREHLP